MLPEENITDSIHMLYGAIIFGAFIVKMRAETVTILASLIQSDSHILLQFHIYQTATTVHRAEQSAGIAFGDCNLPDFEGCIVEVLEVYNTDVCKQVCSAAGVLHLLTEILVRYLLLAVTTLYVRESAINCITFLYEYLLHLCRVEV